MEEHGLREVVVPKQSSPPAVVEAAAAPRRASRAAAALVVGVAIGAALLAALIVVGGADEEPATQPAALRALSGGAGSNAFVGTRWYVNPTYAASLNASILTADGRVRETLELMWDTPSAYWLDTKAKIEGKGTTRTMEGILADAAAKATPELVTFIVYDLPNRDCHAKASNGEICCTYLPNGRCDYMATGSCETGLAEYKTEYIDRIVKVLQDYDGKVPIVVVIEPDSLPNLSTNRGDPRCGNPATVAAYTEGIAYAIRSIASATRSVTIYLDAGHGGWLGWKNNMQDFVKTIRGLGVAQHLRGFATNVAGYQALGEICPEYDWCLPSQQHSGDACCYDPCGLTAEWNPSQNELNYALHLRKAMSEGIPGFLPRMLIDTGRNGVADERSKCANWCNIRGAGIGLMPTTATAHSEIIDAYFWLKTPGESDGCTEVLPSGESCPRFDTDCASADSIGSQPGEPRAPEAGQWFDYQIKQLAEKAHFMLGGLPPPNASRSTGPSEPTLIPIPSPPPRGRPESSNPFAVGVFYVNPSYSESLNKSISSAEGGVKTTLESMRGVPSAYWLDKKSKIFGSGSKSMEGILADAAAKSTPELVTFIVYDLPNRDCHAKASNGEICCTYLPNGRCDYMATGSCETGLAEYKTEYIDRIVKVLQDYDGKVPIVVVIEPDSLPNLSTNRGDPRCGNPATVAAYTEGIAYAIRSIASATRSVTIYLDAGHGGWLGWKNNMQDFVKTIRGLGVAQHLRGFATNVAGYQALGEICPEYDWCLPSQQHSGDACCYDPCGLTAEWNPSQNELNYALHLRKAMSEGIPGFVPRMLIDTGRNGVADERSKCANWCNIRGAGIGLVPTTATANSEIIDAYFWLKTPGESDGCTEVLPSGESCPRFDTDCASADSIGSQPGEPRAPEAGQWFDYQIKQLAENAHMASGGHSSPEPSPPVVRPDPTRTPGGQPEPSSPTDPVPTVPPGGRPASSNPFAVGVFYVNPSYSESLNKSISSAEGSVKTTLESMRGVPSAYWLDKKSKIFGSGSKSMEGILADAAAKATPELVTFIVYDLPNRDCHAKASNGEICCTYLPNGRCDYMATGSCETGLAEYKTEYIDRIVKVLQDYDGKVPIVVVIEPDSLPNLSTNRGDPRCGNPATVAAYTEGIAYAIRSIASATRSVTIYLDAGHGGWLGWKNNMQDFVKTIRGLGVTQHLRGFATNVAGYQALGEICPEYDWCLPSQQHSGDACCYDPCGLTAEWNPSQNELNYALHLRKAMSEGIPGFVPRMLIDTGRNGVADERSKCANWCNIRGAGIGLMPTTATANSEIIDAYFWLKTPGESDGCTEVLPSGESCPRFDTDCASADSIGSQPGEPRAPEAGQWFDYQIKQLAENAHMASGGHSSPEPSPPVVRPDPTRTPGGQPEPSSPADPVPTVPPGERPASSNPFAVGVFYVNPSYSESLNKSISSAEGSVKTTLESMRGVPSAYWLDKKSKVFGSGSKSMEGILADAAAKATPELVTFIVYDLPNRDCHAKASNGEICCTYLPNGRCDYMATGSCETGLAEYKTEYIDRIVKVLQDYDGKVPIVVVIEPDSLPNLSTNRGDPRCGNPATVAAYTEGIAYAIRSIASATRSVTIYLDAGHGGWLGWKNNMQDFVKTIRGLGVAQHLRGFATNVAGYQALGEICPEYDWCLPSQQHSGDACCYDPCGLTAEWNPSQNELNYALHLRKAMSEGIPGFVPRMLIDTGRNGVADERSKCANWCNIRGAGIGLMPTTATANSEIIDAYFWLKTPGESDGCTEVLPSGESCPRFDTDCASADSIGSQPGEPRAPEAGQWFDYQIKQLAENARMASGGHSSPEPSPPVVRPDPTRTPGGQPEPSSPVDPLPTVPPGGRPASSNPFAVGVFYVNPSYSESLNKSISSAEGSVKTTLESMRGVPSAYWLDKKSKVFGSGSKSMEGILADAAAKATPELVTFIVYDLPNRDCHAKASNGEICCTYLPNGRCDYMATGSCETGLAEYKTEYIDRIVKVLQDYDGKVPIVVVIEPDSLPNLSTNRGDPRCGNPATVAAYTEGIAYAIRSIASATRSVTIYLDAGHGGWLGWKNNMQDFVKTIRGLGVAQHLRGFATNVAGYQALGEICPEYDWCLPSQQHSGDACCYDPCGLTAEWNPSQNELNYALHLRKAMSEGIPGFVPRMLIDTGRNGVADERSKCANWCNIRGAGVGLMPTTATANSEIIDAYFWLKTPGESDGCTEVLPSGESCPRFDTDCASADSIGSQPGEPRAPEAGQWFDYQIKQLAENAHMASGGHSSPEPSPPVVRPDSTRTPAGQPEPSSPVDQVPTVPPGGRPASLNPFAVGVFYVNPSYSESLNKSISSAEGSVKTTLESMRGVPSAYWLDKKSKIFGSGSKSMEGILADAAAKATPELVTFVVYDLPNRDCHAKASNGEICCTYLPNGRCDYMATGSCETGLAEYKTEYIDRIVKVLQDYDGKVPIVVVIEPDSLPNLSTNRGDRRCGNPATVAAYTEGIAYAIRSIASATRSVTIYLDAGHGGWLGWKNNMQDFVKTIRGLGVAQHLRGFATNVAGYQALGEICPEYDWCLPSQQHSGDACCYDPCGLTAEWNPSQNELNYALHLRKAMSEGIPGFVPRMLIDTGRNGVADERSKCANWCNIRGAGVGLMPTTATANSEIIDAYFWLKTPGESDGCTEVLPSGESCPRFDTDCASADSIGSQPGEPRAPEAGQWFDYQIKQLAENARMASGGHSSPEPSPPVVRPDPTRTPGGQPEPSSPVDPLPTVPPGGRPASSNPFAVGVFYVNPSYSESLNKSISSAEGSVKTTLESMRGVPSAYWLDKKSKIFGSGSKSMEGILADAAAKATPELVTFIVYDLPNRDCHAKASNGEICCTYLPNGRCDYMATGSCETGLAEYKTEYIDRIVKVLQDYDGKVPIVVVIEPDSLPNLSTNRGDRRCGNPATVAAYTEGIAYAIRSIASATRSVTIYLDAGHGGWLGWKNNMQDFVKTIRGLGVAQHLRGFATNVAGYQALGEICPEYDWCLPSQQHSGDACCYDPCGLTAEWNPSQNELNYALHLRKAMSEGIPGFVPRMLIDTGRNGVADERSKCANWCNIRGAGVGLMPTTATANSEIIDAYFWLKTPGESDGCTEVLPSGESCPRFDTDCASADSIGSQPGEPRAPEAGQWFDYQIKQLASNAVM